METVPKLGVTGQRVARNVKELRGRVPVRELSERLTTAGRPILPSGITKIEQGSRRVDVDDLVALALVLDVAPNRLLLTQDASADEEIEFFPNGSTLSTRRAWDWATGAGAPIVNDWHSDRSTAQPWTIGEVREKMRQFMLVNRPNDPPDLTSFDDMTPHNRELYALADAFADLESKGISRKAAMNFVRVVLDTNRAELDSPESEEN